MIPIPTQMNLAELQRVVRAANQELDGLTVRNIDMGQRRVTNAGKSVSPFDYVTKFELEALRKDTTTQFVTVNSAIGSSGSSAPGATRGSVSVTTASLLNNALESGSLDLGKSSIVYKIVADQFCRVSLYSTSTGRDADVARDPTTQPSSNADLLLDVVMNASALLTFRMMPPAIAENQDGTVTSAIYYNITNLSGGSTTITVTVTRLLLES